MSWGYIIKYESASLLGKVSSSIRVHNEIHFAKESYSTQPLTAYPRRMTPLPLCQTRLPSNFLFFLRAGAAQGFMRSLQELLISEKSWVTCLASGLPTSFKHLFEYVTQGLALLSTSSRLVKQWIGMLVRLLKINKMCLKAWEPASLAFLNGGWSKLCLCSSSAAISLRVIPTFASIQCSPTKQAFLFAFKKFFFFYIA